jgi:hypothetical protein
MGEQKARKRAHAELLARQPHCIYCGGTTAATTVDHMPPITMFRSRHRPKGLEFSSCEECNQGSRIVDIAASMFSRIYPDPSNTAEEDEMVKAIKAVSNNIPGMLEEMQIDESSDVAKRTHDQFGSNVHALNVNGPLVQRHMKSFALRLGLALHFEVLHAPLTQAGSLAIRWYTNHDRATGALPDEALEFLGPARTLEQGRFSVGDQFSYQWAKTPENTGLMTFSTFRLSFAVLSFSAPHKADLFSNLSDEHVYGPRAHLVALSEGNP